MNGVNPILLHTDLRVGFHPNNICCEGCWCMVNDPHCRDRKICFLTQEIIHYPKQMGLRCPLVPMKEDHNA